MSDTAIHLPICAHPFVHAGRMMGRFRFVQQQVPSRKEGEGQLVEHYLLEIGSEGTEDIPAHQEINAREVSILTEVVCCKDHHLTQRPGNTIAMVKAHEEPLHELW